MIYNTLTKSSKQTNLPYILTMDITKKDKSHIERAIYESRRSTMMMKHGCVIASGSKIVATGFNNLRTRFRDSFIEESCSCHAEIDALRKIYHNRHNHSHGHSHSHKYSVRGSSKGLRKLRSEE